MTVQPPAPAPCGSCPYRQDVPSGLWHPDEYRKLPGYDREMVEQPPGVFLCHRQDGHACAGWCAVHDVYDLLAFRLAVATGTIDPDDADAFVDYTTAVPVFASGAEAAEHGLREVDEPGPQAVRAIEKLRSQGVRGG